MNSLSIVVLNRIRGESSLFLSREKWSNRLARWFCPSQHNSECLNHVASNRFGHKIKQLLSSFQFIIVHTWRVFNFPLHISSRLFSVLVAFYEEKLQVFKRKLFGSWVWSGSWDLGQKRKWNIGQRRGSSLFMRVSCECQSYFLELSFHQTRLTNNPKSHRNEFLNSKASE